MCSEDTEHTRVCTSGSVTTEMFWPEAAVLHAEFIAYSHPARRGYGRGVHVLVDKRVTVCWTLLCPSQGFCGRAKWLDVLLLWVFPNVMQ